MPPQEPKSATKNPKGGRPRTAWTSSRRRKLVRLYTLTSLDKDEIQQVIRADDFNPSSSDIQKKLRGLLPKDYAKNYRSYRPSSHENGRVRFLNLPYRSKRQTLARPNDIDDSHCKITGPVYQSGASQSGFHTSPCSATDISNIATVNPSELTCLNSTHTDSNINLQYGSVSPSLTPTTSIFSASPAATLPTDSSSISPTPSIRSLAKRLIGPYSNSYLGHVRSVLVSRTSSLRSLRSSIISFASSSLTPTEDVLMGAGLSIGEQRMWNELVDESRVLERRLSRPVYRSVALTSRSCCGLTLKEDVEVQLPSAMICADCGFLKAHYLARTYEAEPGGNDVGVLRSLLKGALNAEDCYGNTPLHFMAASDVVPLESLMALIQAGANVNASNSSGETFLHVLQSRDTSREPSMDLLTTYRTLISLVTAHNFNLQTLTHHGTTLTHIFLAMHPTATHPHFICGLLLLLSPDLNALDNLGASLKDICLRRMNQQSWSTLHRFRYHDYYDASTADLDFTARRIEARKEGDKLGWGSKVGPAGKFVDWVDVNGDSLLAAMIKSWPTEDYEMVLAERVEELLVAGANVHVRDRSGNTALVTAVRLGYRPVVAVLLKAQSNIFIRDYRGRGVVRQAKSCLLQAQKSGDDVLYARVLSCLNAVVDAGAIARPTERNEMMTERARARGEGQDWIICQDDNSAVARGAIKV